MTLAMGSWLIALQPMDELWLWLTKDRAGERESVVLMKLEPALPLKIPNIEVSTIYLRNISQQWIIFMH
jgi:hypothetical protein